MATSPSYGSDTVIVVVDRKCARQMLLALTLALGGTPVKTIVQGKKGKGGKSGGGKASTSPGTKTSGKTSGGKSSGSKTSGSKTSGATASGSTASGSSKSPSVGGKLTTTATSGGAKNAKKKK